MKRALSLVLVLLMTEGAARAEDGGEPDAGTDVPLAYSVESAVLTLDDGQHTRREVDGGFWGNDALMFDWAREKAAMKAENDALKKTPAPLPWTVVLAIGLGFTAGLAGGVTLGVEGCKFTGCH